MANKLVTFTCISCPETFTTSDSWDNWYQAGQHEREMNHATCDQDRYVRQVGPKHHGISA